MMIERYHMYEPASGWKHTVEIVAGNGGYYLKVDGEFYSTHESRNEAMEEMMDVINSSGWTGLKPFA